ncbi:hypothetical protein [Xylocopilactobacillus apicola]|nr:hypothetical protein [Xylocopilactobacillus apicola]
MVGVLKFFAKREGFGVDLVCLSFKDDLDEYETYHLVKPLDDQHVLAEVDYPARPVDYYAYLDFETFYDYTVEAVMDILAEDPKCTKLIPLLREVKKGLGLD